jgi:enterochelin esterase family protein
MSEVSKRARRAAAGLVRVTALLLIATTLSAPSTAQEVGMRPGGAAAPAGTALASPVVANGRVTFNLRAPEAKGVTVSGDFGPDTAMTRGPDGVWTATVGPLKPEEYVYYFIVDGVRLPDPANPQVKIGYVTSTTTSLVTVPGEGTAFFDVQDVPHGELRTLLYKSRSNGTTRELNVYLPPGYDGNSQRYPVLYLLHGFANDHHSWHRYGRANDILDNLLAKKSIKPFIVVMPLGYGGASVNGDGNGIPPANAGAFGGDFALYERDILEDVIPLIDGKYRTVANRDNRAIVGFSMGGMQAGRFGLGHLEVFSQVGIMSAGLLGNPASAAAAGPDPIAPLAANPSAANGKLKLLWIACGTEDTAMAGARSTHEALEKAGIRHTFVESEGAHHWRVWRRYLRDLAPLLFR